MHGFELEKRNSGGNLDVKGQLCKAMRRWEKKKVGDNDLILIDRK